MTDDAPSNSPYYFDELQAQGALSFVQEFCSHVHGPLAGQRLRLQAWQREIVTALFGYKTDDGLRRYRSLWMELPRKSGKSTFVAAIGLYMLMVDQEPGAEIVIAAGNARQASICFDIARAMVQQDPDLGDVCRVSQKEITYKDARLRVCSSRQRAVEGQNISCLIFDDLHGQRSADLHDALITSMAARAQPLAIYVGSAGSQRCSFGGRMHDYAMKIRDGVLHNPSWLVRIFGATPSDDWTDPAVWRRAHPGLGVSVPESFIQTEYRRALQSPGFAPAFRRMYLNVWESSNSRWLNMDLWDDCGRQPVNVRALEGKPCVVGLDLSTTTDLSAAVLVFRDEEDGYTVLPYAFCPEQRIEERQRRDHAEYKRWCAQGHMIATPGNTVDHNVIHDTLIDLSMRFKIREIAFDRWNSSMLISQLMSDGFSCVPVAQTNGTMNAPSRELERLIGEGKLNHGGHPVLRWCAENAIAKINDVGELRPSKSTNTDRIDLIVALVMALARQAVSPALRRRRAGAALTGRLG